MSGGSWEYFYSTLNEVAERLVNSNNPLRSAMGEKLKLASQALHDIEWVDSGDYGDGDDIKAIKKFIGNNSKDLIARTQIDKIKKYLSVNSNCFFVE